MSRRRHLSGLRSSMDGEWTDISHPANPTEQRAPYRFVARGDADAMCIVLRPVHGDLPILEDGMLGLDLRPGTTMDEAEAFRRELNRLVAGVTYRDE
jgi:hypothetical protein